MDFLQAVAAKYGCEFVSDSLIFDLGPGEEVGLYLDIPEKWDAYLLNIFGYVTEESVKIDLMTKVGGIYLLITGWDEFPDTFIKMKPLLLEKCFREQIVFGIINNSSATATVCLGTDVILVPEVNTDSFERDLKEFKELMPTLLRAVERLRR